MTYFESEPNIFDVMDELESLPDEEGFEDEEDYYDDDDDAYDDGNEIEYSYDAY